MSTALLPTESANVVDIDWYDENERISVRPRKSLRFTVQKDIAIEVLRIAQGAERFTPQFELLLEKLGAWVGEHSGDIARAIVTLQDASLMFLVVQSQDRYEEQLQDDLADLDFAIAQDAGLDLIRLRTMMLPPVDQEALSSFVDARMVMRYRKYGD